MPELDADDKTSVRQYTNTANIRDKIRSNYASENKTETKMLGVFLTPTILMSCGRKISEALKQLTPS